MPSAGGGIAGLVRRCWPLQLGGDPSRQTLVVVGAISLEELDSQSLQ